MWELVVRAAHVPDYLFPAPTSVASSLADDSGLLARATLVTLREIVLGYLLAIAVALAIAVILHFSPALRRALLPLLILSQTAALALVGVLVPLALAGPTRSVTVMLDWTPNPDHVGLYDAQQTGLFARAGLDVTIRAPSNPTTPVKLVGAGRTDVAVSYEQELFFAAAKKLPVVAVAAAVGQRSTRSWRSNRRSKRYAT